MRLTDVNALIEQIELLCKIYAIRWTDNKVMVWIDNIPTVDAVEVVRQNAVDAGWTEAHLDELSNDFYLIPKDDGERRNGDE